VHYKFIAFNCCKVSKNSTLCNSIQEDQDRLLSCAPQEETRTRQRDVIPPAPEPKPQDNQEVLLPIIPLEKVKIPTDDKDKSQFISFDLKVRAGAGAKDPNYKKFMRTFEEGTPQEWMDVLSGLREIWKQNSVNGPTDCAATVAAILKGDSLTAFETALEDARMDPEDFNEAPLAMDDGAY
jgi:hypothetical protein